MITSPSIDFPRLQDSPLLKRLKEVPPGLTETLIGLLDSADARFDQGDYEEARALWQQIYDIAQATGNNQFVMAQASGIAIRQHQKGPDSLSVQIALELGLLLETYDGSQKDA